MKKRLISILLAVAMTLSLAACGQTESNSEKENVKQEANQQGDTSIDPEAPFEETVTLTIAMRETPSVNYAEGDSETNNPWIRAYKERFNIAVEPTIIVASDEYETKINLAIAEKDLPDVFYVTTSQLKQLVEADMICDLTEAYENYASDGVKDIMNYELDNFESGKFDGKLYGLAKLGFGTTSALNYLWIRKDWKDGLNLEAPQTMDDLAEMCKAFMAEYGAEYGIGVTKDLGNLYNLACGWGAYPRIWVENEETGKLEHGAVQPEMKEALAAFAKWYEEGIIDQDFAAMDFAQVNEDIISGKIGVTSQYDSWLGYSLGPNLVREQGTDAYLEAYVIPSATDENVLFPVSNAANSYLVVSKKCEHPEALIKVLNFYDYVIKDMIAEEGAEVAQEFQNNGMLDAVAMSMIDPRTELDDFRRISEAVEKRDDSIVQTANQRMKYEQCIDWIDNQNPDAVGYFMQQAPDISSYACAERMLDAGQVIFNKIGAVQPQTIQEMGSVLSDILVEGFTKIIMGEESIDYFETVVENWMAAGGEQATIEANEIAGK